MSRRLVRALLLGALAGLGVALLLRAAILNTPVQIPPHRLFWQAVLLALGGALAGLGLSAVAALQAANPDPAYHQHQAGLRPRGRRPEPPNAPAKEPGDRKDPGG